MSPGYQAIQDSAAWLDASCRGRIRVRGEDRLRLLHALASNVVESLRPCQGTETFFLSPQGRIQAYARVYVAEDNVLLDCDPERRQALVDYLNGYIIMDDVELDDVTESTAAWALAGPGAAEIAVKATGFALSLEPPNQHGESDGLRVFGSSLVGGPGVWIAAAAERSSEVTERIESAGAVAATEDDFRLARVENGAPRLGEDYFATNIPHETGLFRAVSFNKGCYVGQEIVERVETQGQVQRRLAWLEIDAAELPPTNELKQEGRTLGELTSAVYSPRRDKVLGFALLRREAAEPDASLSVGGVPARTLDFPRG